jgi:hypothetical protein
VGLLLSGALFKILNLVWLSWWVGVPISIYMADRARQRARAAADSRGGGGGGGWGAAGGGGGGGGASAWDRTGPVVEAEWVSLDDEGRPKAGGGRK